MTANNDNQTPDFSDLAAQRIAEMAKGDEDLKRSEDDEGEADSQGGNEDESKREGEEPTIEELQTKFGEMEKAMESVAPQLQLLSLATGGPGVDVEQQRQAQRILMKAMADSQGVTVADLAGMLGGNTNQDAKGAQYEPPKPPKPLDDMTNEELTDYMAERDRATIAFAIKQAKAELGGELAPIKKQTDLLGEKQALEQKTRDAYASTRAAIVRDWGYEIKPEQLFMALREHPGLKPEQAIILKFSKELKAHAAKLSGPKGGQRAPEQNPAARAKQKEQTDWATDPAAAGLAFLESLKP